MPNLSLRWFLLGCLMFPGCGGPARHVVALYETGDYAGAARAADQGLADDPRDEALWQMRVRSALALGDATGVAKAYATYRAELGDDDRPLLRDLAIATLDQALGSPSTKLKLAAIAAVVAAELEPLADRVAERMTDDDDRVAAAAAVAVMRAYPQAPKLAGDLLRSDDPEARRIAVDGVGQKAGKLALDDLRAAAADPDARVRRAAMRWLGELEDTASAELLARGVRDGDETVRSQATTALAQLARVRKAGTANLGELARIAVADRALAVRLAGIELLVAMRSADARTRLAQLIDDADPFVATEAAIAAGGGGPAARALDRAASAPDWTIRAGAANLATRAVGKPAALTLARKLAADPALAVRLAAARVIAGADRAAAVAIFAAVLADPEHRLAAATDLALNGDPRGAEALAAAVGDPAQNPAGRAAAAAAHRTARLITPGLVAALADASGVVRVEAAAVLALLARRD